MDGSSAPALFPRASQHGKRRSRLSRRMLRCRSAYDDMRTRAANSQCLASGAWKIRVCQHCYADEALMLGMEPHNRCSGPHGERGFMDDRRQETLRRATPPTHLLHGGRGRESVSQQAHGDCQISRADGRERLKGVCARVRPPFLTAHPSTPAPDANATRSRRSLKGWKRGGFPTRGV